MAELRQPHSPSEDHHGASAYPDDSAPVNAFPSTEEEFRTDPRVSFSRVSGKWMLEADDGSEYEYDEKLHRWIPVVDEELLEKQQAAYAVAGVDETEPAQQPRNKKKRKVYTSNEAEEDTTSGSKKKNKGNGTDEKKERKNTSIYITNLPLDATADEIQQVFSKAGVISEEIDGGKPRIKIYTDENGKPKGDALVVYFRPESVDLAINLLDDTDFRFGVPDERGPMRVQAADFSYKQNKVTGGDGEAAEPKKRSMKEKRKVMAKTQKLNNKLADWDDDDPSAIATATTGTDLATKSANARAAKTVILKHMFTLQELEEDPAAILDLKEDVREECAKLGDISSVVLYDREADGVVMVRFTQPEAAAACVAVMDGRFFSGQRVQAYIWDGVERFQKDGKKGAGHEDEDAEEQERLEKFGEWLEKEGK